jgi:hypothetical protein
MASAERQEETREQDHAAQTAASRQAQGLPPTIEDSQVLDTMARLLTTQKG